MISTYPLILLMILAGQILSVAATSVVGPLPYQRRADSPFYGGILSGDILLDDFEDQQLNTPGVRMRHGVTDEDQGVDEDDGVLDGFSRNWTWSNAGQRFEEGGRVWSLEINLDRDPLRGYPRYVGLALLGWSGLPPEFASGSNLLAFDDEGNEFPSGVFRVEAIHLPPTTPYFSTAGTQFAGFFSETGISRVLIGAQNLDHLQFGWAIPEPGTVMLSSLAAALLLLVRHRYSPAQHPARQ